MGGQGRVADVETGDAELSQEVTEVKEGMQVGAVA
jgi:hypothetical protein